MRKTKCLICGEEIYINDNLINCPTCNNKLNYDVILKTNKIETLKHDALMYIINNDYNKLLIFIDNNYDNLLLEYYRMYSYISLNKLYDKNIFYSFNLQYTQEELDTIILHMIEHKYMFDNDDILLVIDKSNNKNYYLNILNNNDTIEIEKTKEKDIREFLFPKTKIVQAKRKETYKANSITLMIFAGAIHIFLFFTIMLSVDPRLQYSLFCMLTIIPSILLSVGLSNLCFKNNKAKTLITVLLIIGSMYYLSLPALLMLSDTYTIFNHHIGVFKAPFEFFKLLLEGMQYEG